MKTVMTSKVYIVRHYSATKRVDHCPVMADPWNETIFLASRLLYPTRLNLEPTFLRPIQICQLNLLQFWSKSIPIQGQWFGS